ncbi:MAG: ribosomal protein S18-alanine N-acetyltransferase [Lachnospiraceae bacterium]|nr:ribosomal protein S18-alanine N-acetyltransferase [Lachnospiraceae bacterium]
MCKLNIRRMEEGDLDQVCAIEEETFSMPWSRKSFRDTISYYHTLFLVAELDGEIAGYCGCYQSLEEAEITNIAVRRQLRGHGIGRRLLMELMRLGKEQGAFAYTLEVRVSNQAAIHLYESLGFVSFGIRKNFYEKPREDAMIMWRHWEA